MVSPKNSLNKIDTFRSKDIDENFTVTNEDEGENSPLKKVSGKNLSQIKDPSPSIRIQGHTGMSN